MMKKILIVLILMTVYFSASAQDKFTDPRDGNTYRTITVAGMVWMAENLKFMDKETTAHLFDNDPNNLNQYGVLYDWHTAVKVCPDGWHLPSGDEYHMLLDNAEVTDTKNMKSGPKTTDFQLAGMKSYEGVFTEMDESGYYWTSTEYNEGEAEFFSYLIMNGKSMVDISRKTDMPDIHGAEKTNKYSVRCVKNVK